MNKKIVFVSFDYENDRRYKFLLDAWNANPEFDFVFSDITPGEIDTYNIDRVKAGLTAKINESSHTLVIIGKYANQLHKDSRLTGYRNWINFEVAKSIESRNKIVAVKLDRSFENPEELKNVKVSWAFSFHEDAIIQALNQA